MLRDASFSHPGAGLGQVNVQALARADGESRALALLGTVNTHPEDPAGVCPCTRLTFWAKHGGTSVSDYSDLKILAVPGEESGPVP